MVGHRPPRREAGRAEEVAQRLSKPRQLEASVPGAEDDAVLQARKRPLLPRHFAGSWLVRASNQARSQVTSLSLSFL